MLGPLEGSESLDDHVVEFLAGLDGRRFRRLDGFADALVDPVVLADLEDLLREELGEVLLAHLVQRLLGQETGVDRVRDDLLVADHDRGHDVLG